LLVRLRLPQARSVVSQRGRSGGLFGWIALAHYVLWDPPIDSSSHSFMMQIGMMLGFLTSWPVNRWVLTKGVKEPMMAAGRTPIPPMVAA
jgi:hypothetical protein